MTKVLIVEDDLRLKLTYDTIFTQEGYEVLRATDGAAGLEIAEKEEPDVILLDLMMPVMDGMEFMRRFDVKNKHPNVKIIVFSNMATPEAMKQAYELGATRYEIKATFSPKQVASLVKETLAQKSSPQPPSTQLQ